MYVTYLDLTGNYSDGVITNSITHREIREDLRKSISLENIAQKYSLGIYQFPQNEELASLAWKKCQNCHGKGLIQRDFPDKFVAIKTCLCVDRKLEKKEKQEKTA